MQLSGVIAHVRVPLEAGTGLLAVTEAGDTLSGAGRLRIGGILALTEDSDTLLAVAFPPITGALTATEDGDTLVSAGEEVPPIFGVLDRAEEADTIAAVGARLEHLAGDLALAEADDTLAATGGDLSPKTGTASITEGDDTLAATGAFAIPPVVMDKRSTIGGSTAWNMTGFGIPTLPGDIILVTFYNPTNTSNVTNVTGVGCGTFAQRGTRQNNMEVWWGPVTSGNSQVDITINTTSASGAQQPSFMLIRGAADPDDPFDPNPAFPKITSGNSASYTTDNPGDLLIFGAFNTASGAPTTPPTWTNQISNNWFNTASTLLATKAVNAQQSALGATSTGATFNYADAISGTPLTAITNAVLREDSSYELREDGDLILRES